MIKAIETYYNGYRFRSRLEARWAVFFDALGVKYEYEPEGFDLGDGLYYLPDFRVECWGTRGSIEDKPFDLWIEVKGRMTKEDAEKIKKFAFFGSTEQYNEECNTKWKPITNPILILGNIPNKGEESSGYELGSYNSMNNTDIYPFNLELVDGDFFGTAILASNGKLFLGGDDSNYGMINSESESAYDAARKARFEYDEKKKKTFNPFVFKDNNGVEVTIKSTECGRIVIEYPLVSDFIKAKCAHEPLLGAEHAIYMIYALNKKDLFMKYLKWVEQNGLELGNWLPFD